MRIWGCVGLTCLALAVPVLAGKPIDAGKKPRPTIAADAPAAANGDSASGEGGIRLQQCRVVLRDNVSLACDRSGVLKSVDCREGQRVKLKERVALIADDVAKANLAVAEKKGNNESDVNLKKKIHEQAAKESARNEATTKQVRGSVSELELEKSLIMKEKTALDITQAIEELNTNKLHADVARAELATYSVLAAFEGTITRVFKKQGEAVRQGDPIVELMNSDLVRIEGWIPLAQLRYAKQGGKVRVHLSIPDVDLPEEQEEFTGEIFLVDLVSDRLTHETRVVAEVKNRDNILRGGLLAEMILDTAN